MNALTLPRLLVYPVLIISSAQLFFGLLSLLIFNDQISLAFFTPALICLVPGLLIIWFSPEQTELQISFRQSLAYVTLTWISCAAAASVPVILVEQVNITDGVFESMSALTTTGATILSNLDTQPKSFLLYRQFLQWLGGMGVVVFVVAILPMLNVGGMKIFKAEVPGPSKDEKLVPRVMSTSRYLWYIYVALTVFCALGYWLAGMSGFDAIAHSFTTVSTGGFSTHDASLGYFNSPWIELNADIFMILGATSFTLHFKFSRSGSLQEYLQNEEARSFLWIILLFSAFLFVLLYRADIGLNPTEKILSAVFHLISFLTSTGYGAGDYPHWPAAALLFLVFAGYIGGCAGSTAGGNKIIRNLITLKVIARQIKQLIHPNGVFVIRYNRRKVTREVSSATMAYMVASAMFSIVLTLILQISGLDFWSAFTAVTACINVLGPGFGEVASGFQSVSDMGTWTLTFTMLLGRLEFYSVLALLSPYYWWR